MKRPTSIRAINRARILSLIRRHPSLARADISRRTGLSKGTVSNHVRELLDEGLLYEHTVKGRRQRNVGLSLNRDAGCAVGIELSPDECRAVLTDIEIRPLARIQRPLRSRGVEDTIRVIQSITTELLSNVPQQCLGLVIGLPGPSDVEGQTLVFAESLGWSNVPLAQRLSEHLPCDIKLINRARAGALGEYWHGAGVDVDDLIYVSISSGIAAGILIGGELFTGAYNYNGELGHTTALIDGPECVCGSRGCLETVASMPALIRLIETRLRQGEPSTLSGLLSKGGHLSYKDVVTAASDGDMLVLDEVRSAARYVGIAVASLINLFNPRLVIIGGQLAQVGEIVVNAIRSTAQRRAYPLSFADVQIVGSALGEDSVCIGACALVVDQYIRRLGLAL